MASGIIMATVVIGCVGLFVGLFLGIAAIKFRVEVNPKEEEVLNALPGNNCGGCGFAGCSGLAHAIAEGQAPVNGCPVGGEAVGAVIAKIMDGQKVLIQTRVPVYQLGKIMSFPMDVTLK